MTQAAQSKACAVAAFVAPFLATQIGMSVYSLIHYEVGGGAQYAVAGVWGLLGFCVVAAGLGQDELRASVMGFLGGWII